MIASWAVCSDLELKRNYTHSKMIPTVIFGLEDLWDVRLIDRLDNLWEAMDYAIKKKVDFFVIAGDIFDKVNAPEKLKSLFVKTIKPLVEAKIKVFIIIGNHDTDGKAYNLSGESELLEIMKGDNIIIVDKPWEYKRENFKILMLPWDPSPNSIEKTIKDYKGYIVFGHLAVSGAKLGAHEFVEDDVIDPLVFKNQKRVYLGHYHKHQKVGSNIYYTGSIAKKDMGERMETKGFMYSYLKDNGEIIDEFIPVNDRPFLQWEIREGGIDIFDRIEKEGDLKGAIIKVIFIGSNAWYHSYDKKRITDSMVENNALKIFFDFINSDKVTLRVPEVKLDSKFEDAIKHVIKKEKKEDDPEYLSTGLKILKEIQEL